LKDKGLKEYLLLGVKLYCYFNKVLLQRQEKNLRGGPSNLLNFHV